MTRGRLLITSAGVLLAACVHEPTQIVSGNGLAAVVATLDFPDDGAVLVGTGDIADCESLAGAEATGELIVLVLERRPDAIVFTTGDHAYPDGAPEQFAECYDPVWGSFNARTTPTPGNHDYETPGAAGFFDYFEVFTAHPGARPTGYYAFEHGAWLVVVLNSLLAVDAGSVQVQWLERVLAESAAECVIAIWHHPLRSSGFHGYVPWDEGRGTDVLWNVLQRHGADVVLNGHDHLYERFGRLDADGRPDDAGLRQFTVGTGGAGLHPIVRQRSDSEYLTNEIYGVLVLVLRPRGYDWTFVGVDGAIHDRSSASVPC